MAKYLGKDKNDQDGTSTYWFHINTENLTGTFGIVESSEALINIQKIHDELPEYVTGPMTQRFVDEEGYRTSREEDEHLEKVLKNAVTDEMRTE